MKTIEISKTVTEQITVEFPLYTSDGVSSYRFDDDGCISIKNNKWLGFCIEEYKNDFYPKSWMQHPQITEKEFKRIWQEVQSEITLKYHSVFSKPNEFVEMVSGGNEE